MDFTILFENESVCLNYNQDVLRLKKEFHNKTSIPISHFYLTQNGKLIKNNEIQAEIPIYAIPRLVGGKGGFGSMLRAIGAQIEKTTNREACRDLSGRRLRDINEEQRLKKWIAQQADREKEEENKKLKKLEKLCQQPKFEFKDEAYDKERSALPERAEDAILQGLQASSSTQKRKMPEETAVKRKRPKLWVDADVEDELSTTSDEDSGNEASASK